MYNNRENGKLIFDYDEITDCVNLHINDNSKSIRENLINMYKENCNTNDRVFNEDECNYAVHNAVDKLEYGHGVYLKLDNDKFNPAELFGNTTEEQLYEAMLKNEFLSEDKPNFTDYDYIVRANLSTDKCGRNIKVRDFAAFDNYGNFSNFSANSDVVIPLNNFESVAPDEVYDSAFNKDSKNAVDTYLYPTENKDVSETVSILRKECDEIIDFVKSKGGELTFEQSKDGFDVAVIDFSSGTQTQIFLETGHPFETFAEGMLNVQENIGNKDNLFVEIANEFNDRIGKSIDGKEPVLQLSGGVPVFEYDVDM